MPQIPEQSYNAAFQVGDKKPATSSEFIFHADEPNIHSSGSKIMILLPYILIVAVLIVAAFFYFSGYGGKF